MSEGCFKATWDNSHPAHYTHHNNNHAKGKKHSPNRLWYYVSCFVCHQNPKLNHKIINLWYMQITYFCNIWQNAAFVLWFLECNLLLVTIHICPASRDADINPFHPGWRWQWAEPSPPGPIRVQQGQPPGGSCADRGAPEGTGLAYVTTGISGIYYKPLSNCYLVWCSNPPITTIHWLAHTRKTIKVNDHHLKCFCKGRFPGFHCYSICQ